MEDTTPGFGWAFVLGGIEAPAGGPGCPRGYGLGAGSGVGSTAARS